MEIRVKTFGKDEKFYNLTFDFGTGWHNEEMLTQKEVDNMAVRLVQETVLTWAPYCQEIDALINVGLISIPQLLEWADNWRSEHE